jgi:hypothetical protein
MPIDIEPFLASVEAIPPRKWTREWARLVDQVSTNPRFWAVFQSDEIRAHLISCPSLASYDNRIPKRERIHFKTLCDTEREYWKYGQDKTWPKPSISVGETPVRVELEPFGEAYCSHCVAVETSEYMDDWMIENTFPASEIEHRGDSLLMDDYQPIAYSGSLDDDESDHLLMALALSLGPAIFRILPHVQARFGTAWNLEDTSLRLRLETLIHPILKSGIACLNCSQTFKYVPNASEIIQFEAPVRPYPRGIVELQRLGVTMLCPQCRSSANGIDYPRPHADKRALQAIRDYLAVFGEIPERDWMRFPIARNLRNGPATLEGEIRRRLSVLSVMPMGGPKYASRSLQRKDGSRTNLDGVMSATDWQLLLSEAGITGEARRASRGLIAFATDGHRCKSTLELVFCEFLTRSKIHHEYDAPYADGTRRTADFKALGLTIEIAGLLGQVDYDFLFQKKIADFGQDRHWITLTAKDIRALELARRMSAEDFREYAMTASQINLAALAKPSSQ